MFANLAKMVPQVWNLAEMALKHWILEEKVKNGPWEFTSVTIGPWVKKIEEIASLVPEVSTLAEIVHGFPNFGIYHLWSLGYSYLARNDPCEYFGKVSISPPKKSVNYKIWSL